MRAVCAAPIAKEILNKGCVGQGEAQLRCPVLAPAPIVLISLGYTPDALRFIPHADFFSPSLSNSVYWAKKR